jgi:glycine dehydrogenase subunit 1
MGRKGLQDVARMSARSARAFAEALEEVGVVRPYSGSYFNEFVVDASARPDLHRKLRERGFLMGLPLERWFPTMKDHYLVALSELHYPRLSSLVKEVKDVAQHS